MEEAKGEEKKKRFNFSWKFYLNAGIAGVVLIVIGMGVFSIQSWMNKEKLYKKVIERLSAESRVAEVIVTKSEFDEGSRRIQTTIKFLEFDSKGQPMSPRYFTFFGNIIQFQSLVIRFDDQLIKKGDVLKGKSAYLFMKAFVLDGKNTQVFDITQVNEIPMGYKLEEEDEEYEQQLWEEFWTYALDPQKRHLAGIKNAQIEAPGSMFLPGSIYTLHIEHDGGIRIDSQPIPEILKGEMV